MKPGAPETEGPKPVWRVPTPNARRLSSTGSASPPCEAVPQLKSVEPPCTDPYARWCGRGGAVRLPPIPISAQGSNGWGRKKPRRERTGDVCPASRAQSGARTAPALTRAGGRARACRIRAQKGSRCRPAASVEPEGKEGPMPKTDRRRNRAEYPEPWSEGRLHAENGHPICAARIQIMTKHDIS